MMKYLTAIFVLFLFSISIHAQEVPAALQQRLRGKTDLNSIMKEVDGYYLYNRREEEPENDNEEAFEKDPYLQWKRWEWYTRPRLDSNGGFTDYRKQLDNEYARLTATNTPTSANFSNWSFLGPHQMTYASSEFRGLGRVDCIAFHPVLPGTYYVGAPGGGVWKTTNDGATWDNISFNLPNTSISSIAVSRQNPDVMYVATGASRFASFVPAYERSSVGIYKTTDGGIFWNPVSNAVGEVIAGNGVKIIVHPGNQNIVWVATTAGLYRTTNGGTNWLQLFAGECTDICLKPGNPNCIYLAGKIGGLIFYSPDAGNIFYAASFNVPASTNRIKLGVSANSPQTLYALLGPMRLSGTPAMKNRYEGFLVSADSGRNFTKINSSPNILSDAVDGIGASDELDQSGYDLALAINQSSYQTIVAGGKCVWRTSNGGTSFISATDYREVSGQMYRYIHPDIQDLAFNPLNNYLYAVTDGGVFKSTDNGITWTDISSGIHSTMFYKLAGSELMANYFIGGTQDNGVKCRNTSTSNFDHIVGGDGFDATIDPNSGYAYASGNSNVYLINNGVYLGAIAAPAGASGPFVKLAHHQSQEKVVFAGYQNGLWLKNSGVGWTLLDSFTLRSAVAVITCPSDQNKVYFSNSTGIYRSDNGGFGWTGNLAANTGFAGNRVITDIYVCPTNANFIYATNSNGTAAQKVYSSNDGGATWNNISGSLPNVAINCAVVDNGNNLYVGTDLGVFYKGVSSPYWVPYYNGLPKVIISDLVINHLTGKLTAATYGHGVWQTDLYSICEANFVLTGNYTGERFYSTANFLSSNAEVYGGAGTKMHFKAANEIALTDGFIVYNSSNFDAVIGPCENGAIPESSVARKRAVSKSHKKIKHRKAAAIKKH